MSQPPIDDGGPRAAPKGFFARLKAGFGRGAASLARELQTLVRGRKIDAALFEELESRLLAADVGVEATTALLDALTARVARHELADADALLAALRDELTAILKPCEQPLRVDENARPFVVLVTGVNGSGKTTSIGKLAQRYAQEGRAVTLVAGDTFRAAAVEQLHIWAQRTGARFRGQATGADPAAVVFDALKAAQQDGTQVLIADTAGRLQNQSHLMEELKKVKRVIQRVDASAPHEILQVLDANQGQNALVQAEQFHAALGLTGLVITKLDGSAKGGIVVAIARRLRLPIRFLGLGEGVEDFGEFDASAFAAALVGESEGGGAAGASGERA
jgi:fused signal recognition particle receptor